MAHLDALISDLALILILAGIITLLFKKLKQPVVLGYIVAGFLASPHFTFLPTVTDVANIDIWAEIGIIVLLFSLGLEFSFRKLLNVGGSAVITALVIVIGMMLSGYASGRLLNFSYLDSVFLGGMLSMSSTTIIIKAFTDLNLRKKKFTSLVFGILIVEDLFAVVMMVILSSIAVKNSLEGSEFIGSIAKLGFFLILWFVVGVFLLPSFLKRTRKYLNNETLLVVSMGLCLGMVVLASYVGFSSALGAFVMGSILAGTNEAERIEKVVQPVKDLFGAVFFISVGMLVSPEALAEYAIPILILSIVVIVGQILLGSGGLLLSGQPLKIAVESGFSLSQIGEFAFIIASLGMSLGVIDKYIYPIVVAVSVITTFTTPYFIKMADPFYNWLEKHLPERFRFVIERYSESAGQMEEYSRKKVWKMIMGTYIWRIVLFSTIILAIILLSRLWFIPLLVEVLPDWGIHIAVLVTMVILAPFLWALAMKRVRPSLMMQQWEKGNHSQVPLMVMILLRFALSFAFVIYFLSSVYSQRTGVLLGLSVFIVLIIIFSKKVQQQFGRIESLFMANLNERELRRTGRNNNLVRNMHLAYMDVQADCPFIGRRLKHTNLSSEYGVNIVSIQRGTHRINIPDGETRIFPGDTIGIIGTDEQIQKLLEVIEPGEDTAEEIDGKEVIYTHFIVSEDSKLVGKTSAESGIRANSACLLIGIEKNDGRFIQPNGKAVIDAGDIVWIAGEEERIAELRTQ